MHFISATNILGPHLALILFVSHFLAQASAWQLSSVLSHAMYTSSNIISDSSITFTVARGSSGTNCATNWTALTYPTRWNECDDPMLRWRIQEYNGVSNFTLEIVRVDITKASGATTPTVNITRTSISLTTGSTNGLYCFDTSTVPGEQCALSTAPLSLTTTSASFTPTALDIFYTLTRSDGSSSGVTPCTEAYTFYITDPNVSVLGPLTLGRGTETQWETTCTTNWNCGGTDPSLSSWTSCVAPSFQFRKSLPAAGGDTLSNFVLSVKHAFPLMMATSVRGSNAPDYGLTDPEEAAGLQVVLTLADTVWKDGATLAPIESGGIDQTGNCAMGCEFSGSQVWVDVVDVEII